MGTLILSILVFLFSCTDIIIGVHSPKSLSLLEKPFGDQVFPVVPEGASAVSGGNQQQKAWADPLPEAPSLSEVVVGNTNFDPSAGPRARFGTNTRPRFESDFSGTNQEPFSSSLSSLRQLMEALGPDTASNPKKSQSPYYQNEPYQESVSSMLQSILSKASMSDLETMNQAAANMNFGESNSGFSRGMEAMDMRKEPVYLDTPMFTDSNMGKVGGDLSSQLSDLSSGVISPPVETGILATTSRLSQFSPAPPVDIPMSEFRTQARANIQNTQENKRNQEVTNPNLSELREKQAFKNPVDVSTEPQPDLFQFSKNMNTINPGFGSEKVSNSEQILQNDNDFVDKGVMDALKSITANDPYAQAGVAALVNALGGGQGASVVELINAMTDPDTISKLTSDPEIVASLAAASEPAQTSKTNSFESQIQNPDPGVNFRQQNSLLKEQNQIDSSPSVLSSYFSIDGLNKESRAESEKKLRDSTSFSMIDNSKGKMRQNQANTANNKAHASPLATTLQANTQSAADANQKTEISTEYPQIHLSKTSTRWSAFSQQRPTRSPQIISKKEPTDPDATWLTQTFEDSNTLPNDKGRGLSLSQVNVQSPELQSMIKTKSKNEIQQTSLHKEISNLVTKQEQISMLPNILISRQAQALKYLDSVTEPTFYNKKLSTSIDTFKDENIQLPKSSTQQTFPNQQELFASTPGFESINERVISQQPKTSTQQKTENTNSPTASLPFLTLSTQNQQQSINDFGKLKRTSQSTKTLLPKQSRQEWQPPSTVFKNIEISTESSQFPVPFPKTKLQTITEKTQPTKQILNNAQTEFSQLQLSQEQEGLKSLNYPNKQISSTQMQVSKNIKTTTDNSQIPVSLSTQEKQLHTLESKPSSETNSQIFGNHDNKKIFQGTSQATSEKTMPTTTNRNMQISKHMQPSPIQQQLFGTLKTANKATEQSTFVTNQQKQQTSTIQLQKPTTTSEQPFNKFDIAKQTSQLPSSSSTEMRQKSAFQPKQPSTTNGQLFEKEFQTISFQIPEISTQQNMQNLNRNINTEVFQLPKEISTKLDPKPLKKLETQPLATQQMENLLAISEKTIPTTSYRLIQSDQMPSSSIKPQLFDTVHTNDKATEQSTFAINHQEQSTSTSEQLFDNFDNTKQTSQPPTFLSTEQRQPFSVSQQNQPSSTNGQHLENEFKNDPFQKPEISTQQNLQNISNNINIEAYKETSTLFEPPSLTNIQTQPLAVHQIENIIANSGKTIPTTTNNIMQLSEQMQPFSTQLQLFDTLDKNKTASKHSAFATNQQKQQTSTIKLQQSTSTSAQLFDKKQTSQSPSSSLTELRRTSVFQLKQPSTTNRQLSEREFQTKLFQKPGISTQQNLQKLNSNINTEAFQLPQETSTLYDLQSSTKVKTQPTATQQINMLASSEKTMPTSTNKITHLSVEIQPSSTKPQSFDTVDAFSNASKQSTLVANQQNQQTYQLRLQHPTSTEQPLAKFDNTSQLPTFSPTELRQTSVFQQKPTSIANEQLFEKEFQTKRLQKPISTQQNLQKININTEDFKLPKETSTKLDHLLSTKVETQPITTELNQTNVFQQKQPSSANTQLFENAFQSESFLTPDISTQQNIQNLNNNLNTEVFKLAKESSTMFDSQTSTKVEAQPLASPKMVNILTTSEKTIPISTDRIVQVSEQMQPTSTQPQFFDTLETANKATEQSKLVTNQEKKKQTSTIQLQQPTSTPEQPFDNLDYTKQTSQLPRISSTKLRQTSVFQPIQTSTANTKLFEKEFKSESSLKPDISTRQYNLNNNINTEDFEFAKEKTTIFDPRQSTKVETQPLASQKMENILTTSEKTIPKSTNRIMQFSEQMQPYLTPQGLFNSVDTDEKAAKQSTLVSNQQTSTIQLQQPTSTSEQTIEIFDKTEQTSQLPRSSSTELRQTFAFQHTPSSTANAQLFGKEFQFESFLLPDISTKQNIENAVFTKQTSTIFDPQQSTKVETQPLTTNQMQNIPTTSEKAIPKSTKKTMQFSEQMQPSSIQPQLFDTVKTANKATEQSIFVTNQQTSTVQSQRPPSTSEQTFENFDNTEHTPQHPSSSSTNLRQTSVVQQKHPFTANAQLFGKEFQSESLLLPDISTKQNFENTVFTTETSTIFDPQQSTKVETQPLTTKQMQNIPTTSKKAIPKSTKKTMQFSEQMQPISTQPQLFDTVETANKTTEQSTLVTNQKTSTIQSQQQSSTSEQNFDNTEQTSQHPSSSSKNLRQTSVVQEKHPSTENTQLFGKEFQSESFLLPDISTKQNFENTVFTKETSTKFDPQSLTKLVTQPLTTKQMQNIPTTSEKAIPKSTKKTMQFSEQMQPSSTQPQLFDTVETANKATEQSILVTNQQTSTVQSQRPSSTSEQTFENFDNTEHTPQHPSSSSTNLRQTSVFQQKHPSTENAQLFGKEFQSESLLLPDISTKQNFENTVFKKETSTEFDPQSLTKVETQPLTTKQMQNIPTTSEKAIPKSTKKTMQFSEQMQPSSIQPQLFDTVETANKATEQSILVTNQQTSTIQSQQQSSTSEQNFDNTEQTSQHLSSSSTNPGLTSVFQQKHPSTANAQLFGNEFQSESLLLPDISTKQNFENTVFTTETSTIFDPQQPTKVETQPLTTKQMQNIPTTSEKAIPKSTKKTMQFSEQMQPSSTQPQLFDTVETAYKATEQSILVTNQQTSTVQSQQPSSTSEQTFENFDNTEHTPQHPSSSSTNLRQTSVFQQKHPSTENAQLFGKEFQSESFLLPDISNKQNFENTVFTKETSTIFDPQQPTKVETQPLTTKQMQNIPTTSEKAIPKSTKNTMQFSGQMQPSSTQPQLFDTVETAKKATEQSTLVTNQQISTIQSQQQSSSEQNFDNTEQTSQHPSSSSTNPEQTSVFQQKHPSTENAQLFGKEFQSESFLLPDISTKQNFENTVFTKETSTIFDPQPSTKVETQPLTTKQMQNIPTTSEKAIPKSTEKTMQFSEQMQPSSTQPQLFDTVETANKATEQSILATNQQTSTVQSKQQSSTSEQNFDNTEQTSQHPSSSSTNPGQTSVFQQKHPSTANAQLFGNEFQSESFLIPDISTRQNINTKDLKIIKETSTEFDPQSLTKVETQSITTKLMENILPTSTNRIMQLSEQIQPSSTQPQFFDTFETANKATEQSTQVANKQKKQTSTIQIQQTTSTPEQSFDNFDNIKQTSQTSQLLTSSKDLRHTSSVFQPKQASTANTQLLEKKLQTEPSQTQTPNQSMPFSTQIRQSSPVIQQKHLFTNDQQLQQNELTTETTPTLDILTKQRQQERENFLFPSKQPTLKLEQLPKGMKINSQNQFLMSESTQPKQSSDIQQTKATTNAQLLRHTEFETKNQIQNISTTKTINSHVYNKTQDEILQLPLDSSTSQNVQPPESQQKQLLATQKIGDISKKTVQLQTESAKFQNHQETTTQSSTAKQIENLSLPKKSSNQQKKDDLVESITEAPEESQFLPKPQEKQTSSIELKQTLSTQGNNLENIYLNTQLPMSSSIQLGKLFPTSQKSQPAITNALLEENELQTETTQLPKKSTKQNLFTKNQFQHSSDQIPKQFVNQLGSASTQEQRIETVTSTYQGLLFLSTQKPLSTSESILTNTIPEESYHVVNTSNLVEKQTDITSPTSNITPLIKESNNLLLLQSLKSAKDSSLNAQKFSPVNGELNVLQNQKNLLPPTVPAPLLSKDEHSDSSPNTPKESNKLTPTDMHLTPLKKDLKKPKLSLNYQSRDIGNNQRQKNKTEASLTSESTPSQGNLQQLGTVNIPQNIKSNNSDASTKNYKNTSKTYLDNESVNRVTAENKGISEGKEKSLLSKSLHVSPAQQNAIEKKQIAPPIFINKEFHLPQIILRYPLKSARQSVFYKSKSPDLRHHKDSQKIPTVDNSSSKDSKNKTFLGLQSFQFLGRQSETVSVTPSFANLKKTTPKHGLVKSVTEDENQYASKQHEKMYVNGTTLQSSYIDSKPKLPYVLSISQSQISTTKNRENEIDANIETNTQELAEFVEVSPLSRENMLKKETNAYKNKQFEFGKSDGVYFSPLIFETEVSTEKTFSLPYQTLTNHTIDKDSSTSSGNPLSSTTMTSTYSIPIDNTSQSSVTTASYKTTPTFFSNRLANSRRTLEILLAAHKVPEEMKGNYLLHELQELANIEVTTTSSPKKTTQENENSLTVDNENSDILISGTKNQEGKINKTKEHVEKSMILDLLNKAQGIPDNNRGSFLLDALQNILLGSKYFVQQNSQLKDFQNLQKEQQSVPNTTTKGFSASSAGSIGQKQSSSVSPVQQISNSIFNSSKIQNTLGFAGNTDNPKANQEIINSTPESKLKINSSFRDVQIAVNEEKSVSNSSKMNKNKETSNLEQVLNLSSPISKVRVHPLLKSKPNLLPNNITNEVSEIPFFENNSLSSETRPITDNRSAVFKNGEMKKVIFKNERQSDATKQQNEFQLQTSTVSLTQFPETLAQLSTLPTPSVPTIMEISQSLKETVISPDNFSGSTMSPNAFVTPINFETSTSLPKIIESADKQLLPFGINYSNGFNTNFSSDNFSTDFENETEHFNSKQSNLSISITNITNTTLSPSFTNKLNNETGSENTINLSSLNGTYTEAQVLGKDNFLQNYSVQADNTTYDTMTNEEGYLQANHSNIEMQDFVPTSNQQFPQNSFQGSDTFFSPTASDPSEQLSNQQIQGSFQDQNQRPNQMFPPTQQNRGRMQENINSANSVLTSQQLQFPEAQTQQRGFVTMTKTITRPGNSQNEETQLVSKIGPNLSQVIQTGDIKPSNLGDQRISSGSSFNNPMMGQNELGQGDLPNVQMQPVDQIPLVNQRNLFQPQSRQTVFNQQQRLLQLEQEQLQQEFDRQNQQAIQQRGDLEQQRIEEKQLEVQRQQQLEQLRIEQIEQKRLEQEQLEQQRRQILEQQRLEQQQLEQQRLQQQQAQLEQQRLEQQQLEQQRLQQLEQERQQRLEEQRRQQIEQQRLQQLEQERLEQQRLQQLEQERLQRLEEQRLQQLEQERLEQQQLQQMEQERLEQQQLEQQQLQQLEQERLEKLSQQRQQKIEQQQQEKQAQQTDIIANNDNSVTSQSIQQLQATLDSFNMMLQNNPKAVQASIPNLRDWLRNLENTLNILKAQQRSRQATLPNTSRPEPSSSVKTASVTNQGNTMQKSETSKISQVVPGGVVNTVTIKKETITKTPPEIDTFEGNQFSESTSQIRNAFLQKANSKALQQPFPASVTSVNEGVPFQSNAQAESIDMQQNTKNVGQIVSGSLSSQIINQPSLVSRGVVDRLGANADANVNQIASLSKTRMSPGVISLDQMPPSTSTMTEAIPGMAPISSGNGIPAFDPNAIGVDFSSSNIPAGRTSSGSFLQQQQPQSGPRGPIVSAGGSVGFGSNIRSSIMTSLPTTARPSPAASSTMNMQQFRQAVLSNMRALLRRLPASRRLPFVRRIQAFTPQQKRSFFTRLARLPIRA